MYKVLCCGPCVFGHLGPIRLSRQSHSAAFDLHSAPPTTLRDDDKDAAPGAKAGIPPPVRCSLSLRGTLPPRLQQAVTAPKPQRPSRLAWRESRDARNSSRIGCQRRDRFLACLPWWHVVVREPVCPMYRGQLTVCYSPTSSRAWPGASLTFRGSALGGRLAAQV